MATTTSRRPIGSIRRKGYLFKLPVSGGVIKVWAKRWGVLHSTTHDGVVRLEYFDNEEAEVKGENKRVILLRNCTGCIETTEFKSRPYAFQFSSQQGRHVFAVESKVDLSSWIECINDVIKEDRMKAKKGKKKNTIAEAVRGETGGDSVGGHVPHIGTLMGVYNVVLNPSPLSQALNLSGTYSLDVTPKGMSLISNTTETEVTKWHYKHIKFYSKSSSNVVTVELGRRSPTGEGKFLFQTTVAKELFSMIHRNIKKIKMLRDQKAKEDLEKEIQRIQTIKKRKQEEMQARTLPPKSNSLDISNPHHHTNAHQRTFHRSGTIDPFTSASTIGTVADEDLIHLEGLAELPGIEEELQSELEGLDRQIQSQESRNRLSMGALLDERMDDHTDRNRLSMGATIGDRFPELDSVNQLSSVVYQNPSIAKQQYQQVQPQQDPIYDEPPKDGFSDSFIDGPTNQGGNNPFMNVTDPFSSSARGSFYNADEDIFQSFDQVSSPNKTSTPNHTMGKSNHGAPLTPFVQQPLYSNVPTRHQTQTLNTANPNNEAAMYSNVTEALRGLKDIQLDTQQNNGRPPIAKPRTLKQRPSREEMDAMWGDIAGDLKLP